MFVVDAADSQTSQKSSEELSLICDMDARVECPSILAALDVSGTAYV